MPNEQRFAVALNEQGRFAPTRVLEFCFVPECNAHVWKGMIAESMKDLADQINCAVAFLREFGGPFITMRVIEVGAANTAAANEDESSPESVIRSLCQANAELNETIRNIEMRRPTPTLRLLATTGGTT